MDIHIIAAVARDGAIGQAGRLPWPPLRTDNAWFYSLTRAQQPELLARFYCQDAASVGIRPFVVDRYRLNAVIMGRKTCQSLSSDLSGRANVVLTDRPCQGIQTAPTLRLALCWAQRLGCPHAFLIGGACVFAEALALPQKPPLYLTEIDADYPEASTFWPVPRCQIDLRGGAMEIGDRIYVRQSASAWIEEPGCPRYRFGLWLGFWPE